MNVFATKNKPRVCFAEPRVWDSDARKSPAIESPVRERYEPTSPKEGLGLGDALLGGAYLGAASLIPCFLTAALLSPLGQSVGAVIALGGPLAVAVGATVHGLKHEF